MQLRPTGGVRGSDRLAGLLELAVPPRGSLALLFERREEPLTAGPVQL